MKCLAKTDIAKRLNRCLGQFYDHQILTHFIDNCHVFLNWFLFMKRLKNFYWTKVRHWFRISREDSGLKILSSDQTWWVTIFWYFSSSLLRSDVEVWLLTSTLTESMEWIKIASKKQKWIEKIFSNIEYLYFNSL